MTVYRKRWLNQRPAKLVLGDQTGGARSWSGAPGGRGQFSLVGAYGSVMLAGADVDVVDMVDISLRRRSISSLTVDAMRA